MTNPVLPGFFDPPVEDISAPVDHFDGATYEPEHDQVRLSALLGKVYELMKDQRWRTIREIADAIGAGSEASVSARLRDLRKKRFGSHNVIRRHRGPAADGLYEYSVYP